MNLGEKLPANHKQKLRKNGFNGKQTKNAEEPIIINYILKYKY